MNREQFQTLADGFGQLRIALVGDFCLDRYLEIDGTLQETSLETGREVHNVTQVRVSAGGCGTILNNLVALGVGEIIPVGWIGRDASGWELRRALKAERGVNLDYLIKTRRRKTFTYIKPMKMEDGRSPQELNRLDIKNWTPTPDDLSKKLARSLDQIGKDMDVIILLDQAELPGTGVITTAVLDAVKRIQQAEPEPLIVADSRSGLGRFPPVRFKMNRAELAREMGQPVEAKASIGKVSRWAAEIAHRNGQSVFVTLADEGILAVGPDGSVEACAPVPHRGEIDITGAGDAVTANLATALACGAAPIQACQIAMAAASVVVQQLGTTGRADVAQITGRLPDAAPGKVRSIGENE